MIGHLGKKNGNIINEKYVLLDGMVTF